MRKIKNVRKVLGGFAAFGLVLGMSSTVYGVAGQCDNCHTMHNSQAGIKMTYNAGPNANLTLGDGCNGCHADGTKNNTGAAGEIPQVDGTSMTGALAGGFFDTAGDWANQHNVNDLGMAADITGQTDPNGNPGQFADAETIPGNTVKFTGASATATVAELTCSGTNGCHAVTGAHHANATGAIATVATSDGGSYRFLEGYGGGTTDYVKGIEDDDYEYETVVDHNTYHGSTAPTDNNTLSKLCASCHADFHGAANVLNATPDWIRHPTDYALSGTGEYVYNEASPGVEGVYVDSVPVATPVTGAGSALPTSTGAALTTQTLIVSCVSCHRAHGSDQPDMLRWPYSNMIAGTTGAGQGTGCFVCHTQKDA